MAKNRKNTSAESAAAESGAPTVSLRKPRSFNLYSKSQGRAPAPTVWANGTALEHLGNASGLALTVWEAEGVHFTSEGNDAERARVRVSRDGEVLGFISLLVSNGTSEDAFLMRRYSMADYSSLSAEEKQHRAVLAVFGRFIGGASKAWPFMPEESRVAFIKPQMEEAVRSGKFRGLSYCDSTGTTMVTFDATPDQVARAYQETIES